MVIRFNVEVFDPQRKLTIVELEQGRTQQEVAEMIGQTRAVVSDSENISIAGISDANIRDLRYTLDKSRKKELVELLKQGFEEFLKKMGIKYRNVKSTVRTVEPKPPEKG